MNPPQPPKHLWSGDWREEESRPAPPSPAAEPSPPPAGPPAASGGPPPSRAGRRRRLGPAALAGLAVGALLGAGAFALGTRQGDEPSRGAVLPAASSAPVIAKAGQSRAGAIYAAASPAVVSIRAGSGAGTGFLIDGEGTIVTNAHVVGDSRAVTVHFGENGDAVAGRVLGSDPSSDLAVVRIAADRIPRGTDPLALADSARVGVGETVVAIGNPFGLDRTVTEGIVSAVGRDIQAPNGFQISEAIQTDAAINPGNSGGPLLDMGGTVIGVNSQIETSGASRGNVGVGFAVPSNTVRRVVPTLKEGRTIQRAWLGVSTSDAPGDGALVEQTVPGSPAVAAGLRAGDVITAVGAEKVGDSSALGRAVESRAPGEKVTIEVARAGRSVELDATLRQRPARAP